MKTTINLTEEQFDKLQKTISESIKRHGDKEFDKENLGWKIIFFENGSIEVWHGRYGNNSEKLQGD